MTIRIGPSLLLAGVVATALYTLVTIQRSGATSLFLENRRCCQLSFMRNLQVTLDELRGLTRILLRNRSGQVGARESVPRRDQRLFR